MNSFFLRSLANISPQPSFGQAVFPPAIQAYTGNRLSCIEPDYGKLIDPKSIRRMSRIIRMGVAAAMDCLKQAGLQTAEAIITGTAYGCLADTEVFLTKMVENQEDLLTPTAFIQSTHNTVGAQIALLLSCHGYNNTFVHRGFSFESALLDAMMLLDENPDWNILAGAIDEITDSSYRILSRFGLYKSGNTGNLDLFSHPTRGTLAGEGAAFFLLSAQKRASDYCRIDGLRTFYKPNHPEETQRQILHFLREEGLALTDIDLILLGENGDWQGDRPYRDLRKTLPGHLAVINFKAMCGEYPTAGGFALWLAAVILKTGLPGSDHPPRRILIYNHYQNLHHSLYLLSIC
jgi:3-oxoacyl-[acyl-carrier-protein] synthase II